jgi:DNA polymerase delta subunit 1
LIVSKSKGAVKELSSSALGSNELFIINMIGRCNLDIFHWVKAREKLESYKLDDVCAHSLGEKKVEMDYKDLFKLCTGSASDIAKVAVYCVQDCALLISLILRLQIITANVEMSRVCFTPMEALVTRGQQFKVMNQLVHYGHRENYILNTPERYSGSAGDSYEGATVIDAKAKYYKNPIAVLDFMSLYPSIMLANNFCYSTLVLDPRYMNLPGVVYETIKVTDEKVYVWVKGIQQEDGSVKPMI